MATDPRDVAETIARQRRQQEDAKEELRAVFEGQADWRRLASGSFSSQIGEGVRAVVAPAPAGGFHCNIRVESRIVASRTTETPQDAMDYVNQVRDELSTG